MTDLKESEKRQFKQLEDEILQECEAIKNLDSTEKIRKNSSVISLIKHYVDMTDKVEDRRCRIHTFTLQTLAVFVAATLVLLSIYVDKNKQMSIWIFWPSLLMFIGQIIFCFYSSLIYQRQSGFRYSFLRDELQKYGNTWKWFYYASKPIQQIDTHSLITHKGFDVTIKPFLASYKEYLAQYRSETEDTELLNNIQQLNLLRVHNYYKNKFYLQLVQIQESAVWALLISAAIGAFIAFLIESGYTTATSALGAINLPNPSVLPTDIDFMNALLVISAAFLTIAGIAYSIVGTREKLKPVTWLFLVLSVGLGGVTLTESLNWFNSPSPLVKLIAIVSLAVQFFVTWGSLFTIIRSKLK